MRELGIIRFDYSANTHIGTCPLQTGSHIQNRSVNVL